MTSPATEKFLDMWLSRTKENIEIRCLPSRKRLFTRSKEEALRFIKSRRHENIYCGAGSRNGGGDADHTKEIFALWSDLDFKEYEGKEYEARERLSKFEPQPNIIVGSGGGLQAYWLLEEPICDASARQDELKGILRGIAGALKSDVSVAEVARVLRLPGTTNFKYDPPREVVIERWDDSITHALASFSNNINNYLHIYSESGKVEKDEKAILSNTSEYYPILSEGRRDKDLYYTARCLKDGGMKKETALQVIDMLAKNSNPPFYDRKVEEIIDSAWKSSPTNERKLTAEVLEFLNTTEYYFNTIDVRQILSITTPRDIKYLTVILNRLSKQGIIEHTGQHGHWRKVNTQIEEMDFKNAPTDHLEIKWPFEIQKLVRTYSKNVIVLGGSPDAGKTAFCLNFAYINREYRNKVYYFNSEMGESELRIRLEKLDTNLDEWGRITFIPWSRNFQDVIKPDAINIIDFIELSGDETYKVGDYIRAIFDKLRDGIVLICIQKKRGAELGRGAEFSEEKSRLYLTMEAGKLKIIKAKNWVSREIKPAGLIHNYKLLDGCHFVGDDRGWHREG